MITTGDIADILIEDLKSYGFSAFKSGALPLGELSDERVIVVPKRGTPGKFWTKSFSEINVCVPDISGMADTRRLTEIERTLSDMRKVGEYDGTAYRYSVYSTGQENGLDGKYHFVNIRLLFEILNTI